MLGSVPNVEDAECCSRCQLKWHSLCDFVRIIKPAPLMLMFIQSLALPTSLLLVLSHVGDIRLRI